MARYVDSVSILPDAAPAEDVWRALGHVLATHGLVFEPGSLVVVNDADGQEPEPEEAQSAEEAVARITSWPALGGTEYALAGHKVLVFTFGSRAHHVDVITISTSATPYLADQEFKRAFDALVADVHRALHCARTLCDYEVLSPNSFWLDQLAHVREGRFEGSYAIDLR